LHDDVTVTPIVLIENLTPEEKSYKANITDQDEKLFYRAREESFQVNRQFCFCSLPILRYILLFSFKRDKLYRTEERFRQTLFL